MDVTSVIIPAYNAERWIGTQLESILREEHEGALEIIVGDNGSTDATRAIVAGVRRSDNRVHLIDASATRGAGPARNSAVDCSRGEKLVFADADDIVCRGWLQAQISALDASEVVTGPVLSTADPENLHPEEFEWPTSAEIFYSTVPVFLTANLGIRRATFERIGRFDPMLRYWQDIDLAIRLHKNDVSLHFAPDAKVFRRVPTNLRERFKKSVASGIGAGLIEMRHPDVVPAGAVPSIGGWLWWMASRAPLAAVHRSRRGRWIRNLGRGYGRFVELRRMSHHQARDLRTLR